MGWIIYISVTHTHKRFLFFAQVVCYVPWGTSFARCVSAVILDTTWICCMFCHSIKHRRVQCNLKTHKILLCLLQICVLLFTCLYIVCYLILTHFKKTAEFVTGESVHYLGHSVISMETACLGGQFFCRNVMFRQLHGCRFQQRASYPWLETYRWPKKMLYNLCPTPSGKYPRRLEGGGVVKSVALR